MKKLIIILSVLLVLGSSCKNFLGIDEVNPNQASAVPASLILPAALNATASNVTSPDNFSFVYLWYGCWSVSAGYSQPSQLTQYKPINSSYQNNWYNAYTNLQNYDYMEKNSPGAINNSYRAIAKIMKAYNYQYLVDAYGNVPYSEALKTPGILKPKYDNQQAIYEDLVLQLDTAINLIETSPIDAVPVKSNDIIYGGDMELWKKFANTLKLRLLINQADMTDRTSYISSALATTSSVGYLGVGEGAMSNPGYLKSAGKMNPFWENFFKQDDSQQSDGMGYYEAGQDAVDFLLNNLDPRALLLFAPYSGTSIQGNYFGKIVLNLPPVTSHLGSALLKGFNMSAPIFTDFEALFLQAEAVERGLITGNAKALYEAGVTQSILYMGGSAANTVTYLEQPNQLVNYDNSSNKLRTIITQKWLALNGISPMPIWTDYRRTGYPDFLHFTEDINRANDTPPVRLLYPQTEINTNNDNVLLQGTINLFASKIFWQNR